MGAVKALFVQNLVSEIHRSKAVITFEIKQVENKLNRVMAEVNIGANTVLDTDFLINLVADLIIRYESLAKLYELNLDPPQSSIIEKTVCSSYAKIQALKDELAFARTEIDEFLVIEQIRSYYNHLNKLLEGAWPQSGDLNQVGLLNCLKRLTRSMPLTDWLTELVDFANLSKNSSNLKISLFSQLSLEELQSFSSLFTQDSYITAFNSIYYYKFYPESLYDFTIHPEKLISVRNRISMLYGFIELLQQLINDALKSKGGEDSADYLFHGDEIPQGISMVPDNQLRDLIASLLKDWSFTKTNYSDFLSIKNTIYDLFRAYKFWFNPNRLIDTVMCLQRELAGYDIQEAGTRFREQMRLIYQSMSTTECLDLYGYFSNKDSCYLMRTLSSAIEGHSIPSLGLLDEDARSAVERVYTALDIVMEAIRDELANRKVTTISYSRESNFKIIQPGRRNLNALKRTIQLYAKERSKPNSRIDDLFNQINKLN